MKISTRRCLCLSIFHAEDQQVLPSTPASPPPQFYEANWSYDALNNSRIRASCFFTSSFAIRIRYRRHLCTYSIKSKPASSSLVCISSDCSKRTSTSAQVFFGLNNTKLLGLPLT